jgi:hypothetical protein
MKLSKIALAAAALAAVASGSAFAGQIDSSSATLAREVIWSDTAQFVRAPSKTYSFAGVIDARTNEQRLQLQWTVTGGLVWAAGATAAAGGDIIGLNSASLTSLPINTQQVLKLNATNTLAAPATFGTGAAPTGINATIPGAVVTVDAFVTNGGTTLIFNVTIPAGTNNLLSNVQFQLNSNDFTGVLATASNVGVKNVLTASGPMACVGPDRSTQVNFKHFTSHNGNTVVQFGDITTNPDSEHLRSGSTNDGRFLNFTENLRFTFVNGTQSQTDAATLRTTFIRTAGELTNVPITANNYVTAAATLVVPGTRLHRIGANIDLTKIASGLDLDYATQYGRTGAFLLADFNTTNPTVATPLGLPAGFTDGTVNLSNLVISVTTPLGFAGWANGSTIAVLDSADAAIAGAVVVPPSAANLGVATVTFSTAAAAAAFAAGAGGRLYYVVTGAATDVVPQTGLFNVTATLGKTKAGPTQERDNVCRQDLAGIGGGLKIDIRNYASRTKFPTGNYASFVRLINNSESQSADIFAQMIYADGKYGPWGVLPTLVPRAVMNLSNTELEAFLRNAAPVANPFGASTVYTSDQTAAPTYIGAVAGAGVTGAPSTGDRIRFVSNSGTTLRVQSYLLLPSGNFLDTTSAQGVDFENDGNNRVPLNARDAQPVSQDAINGLARQ